MNHSRKSSSGGGSWGERDPGRGRHPGPSLGQPQTGQVCVQRARGFAGHSNRGQVWRPGACYPDKLPRRHMANQSHGGHTQASKSPILATSDRPLSFFFFFFFLAAPWHMEFLGQGSDLSHSCDLSCSCSNAGSLTHCARPGIEPRSQHSQDAANPSAPQWELPDLTLLLQTDPQSQVDKASDSFTDPKVMAASEF